MEGSTFVKCTPFTSKKQRRALKAWETKRAKAAMEEAAAEDAVTRQAAAETQRQELQARGTCAPSGAPHSCTCSDFVCRRSQQRAIIDHEADGYHSDTLTILDDINLPALAQPSLGCTQARPECDVLISHAVGKQVLESEVRSDSTPRARVRQERCLWKEHLGARSNACRASEEVVLTWLHVVRRRCHLAVQEQRQEQALTSAKKEDAKQRAELQRREAACQRLGRLARQTIVDHQELYDWCAANCNGSREGSGEFAASEAADVVMSDGEADVELAVSSAESSPGSDDSDTEEGSDYAADD